MERIKRGESSACSLVVGEGTDTEGSGSEH